MPESIRFHLDNCDGDLVHYMKWLLKWIIADLEVFVLLAALD